MNDAQYDELGQLALWIGNANEEFGFYGFLEKHIPQDWFWTTFSCEDPDDDLERCEAQIENRVLKSKGKQRK